MNKNFFLIGNDFMKQQTLQPFSEIICDFFDLISKKIFEDKNKFEDNDILALAFWYRKKNILNLKNFFFDNHFKHPLGVVFHITPNNVPINFAYSLFFGLITGNTNIVKVPSKSYFQIDYICKIIKNILKSKKYSKIENMIKIIKYDNDDEVTKKISMISDARLIWGGDKTVNKIKSITSPNKCSDISFPDRYSFSLINLESMSRLKEQKFHDLIKKFYSDNYTFDQNACNSSHLVFWFGEKRLSKIKNKFWKQLNIYLKNKIDYPSSVITDKYNKLCIDIVKFSNVKKIHKFSKNLHVATLNKIDRQIENQRGQWGYFYQYQSKNIKELIAIITKKHQTLAYYGFDKFFFERLFLENQIHGIDRIVPIGRAMEMNYIWDGYNLLNSLTRVIDIK